MKRQLFYSLVLFALLATGCKTKQLSTSHTGKLESEVMVEQVLMKQPVYTTMNLSRIDMEMNFNQRSFVLRGGVRVVKDSLIQVSIQPMLGIEMFRIEFSPSKLTIIDKMNRLYSDASYDYLRVKLGVTVDYKTIQSMISNQLFVMNFQYDPNAYERLFKLNKDSAKLALECLNGNIFHRFELNEGAQITSVLVQYLSKGFVECTYADFKAFDGVLFPQSLQVEVGNGVKSLDAKLTIRKAEFNRYFDVPQMDYSRYKKVLFSEIVPL